METTITLLFIGAALYLTVGLLFAIVFVFKGVQQIDSSAQGASFGFRLLILPGAAVLWPILLKKWLKRKQAA